MAAQLLGGRVALVTGGGSGIGRSICKILARDGARVVAADVNVKGAKATVDMLPNAAQHLACEVNVADKSSVVSAIHTAKKHFQQLPTLLANAAAITRDNFLHKMDAQQFTDVIDVNLKGTFNVNQAFLEALQEAGIEKASVVNFSSVAAKHGNMGQCNYSASKAGVEAFTKSVTKEVAKQGIRMNCVVPGFIETPIVETVPENVKSMVIFITPMKRMGQPEEVAEVVSFLLSDKSSFVTGSCVEVTGGLNL